MPRTWTDSASKLYFSTCDEKSQFYHLQMEEQFIYQNDEFSSQLNTNEMKKRIENRMAEEVDDRITIGKAFSLVGA